MSKFEVGDKVSFTLYPAADSPVFYGVVTRVFGSTGYVIQPQKPMLPGGMFHNIKKVA